MMEAGERVLGKCASLCKPGSACAPAHNVPRCLPYCHPSLILSLECSPQAGVSAARCFDAHCLCLSPRLPPANPAAKVEPKLARWGAKLLAAYRTALQPRLLVLPALLAAAAAYNAAAGPEDQLGLVEQGCLVGGFLSWKVRPTGVAAACAGACGPWRRVRHPARGQ